MPPWMLVNGSTRLAYEKPDIVSIRPAAICTAATIADSANANASPTIASLTISSTIPGASAGIAWPFEASGVSASASAAAITTLAWAGSARAEKIGASTKRPPTRVSTSMYATSCSAAIWGSWTCTWLRATSCGIAVKSCVVYDGDAVEHPRPRDHQRDAGHDRLRHEGQRDLLDLRRRLEDRDDEADDQARGQERQRQLEAEPHGLHGQVDRDIAVHGRDTSGVGVGAVGGARC